MFKFSEVSLIYKPSITSEVEFLESYFIHKHCKQSFAVLFFLLSFVIQLISSKQISIYKFNDGFQFANLWLPAHIIIDIHT